MAAGPPDKTEIEELLAALGVPVSEYVIEAYVRDALFRRETNIHPIIERLVPQPIEVAHAERLFIAQYIAETREDFSKTYNFFQDKEMGPIRQRVAELHTAVVALASRLAERGIDHSWLPKHAFVTLSQLQAHSANLLEDLDWDESPEERELDGMDNALDGMMDMYEDVRSAIEEALDGFRRSRLTLVKPEGSAPEETGAAWRLLQLALVGTSVWRRLLVDESLNLAQLHRCVQASLGWSGERLHGFVLDGEVYGSDAGGGELAERNATIASVLAEGVTEMTYDYDYGAEWEVKISILNRADADSAGRPRCIAGAGAAPSENAGGPLRFRRFVSALRGEDGPEKEIAVAELGADFDPEAFDAAAADRALESVFRGALRLPEGGEFR